VKKDLGFKITRIILTTIVVVYCVFGLWFVPSLVGQGINTDGIVLKLIVGIIASAVMFAGLWWITGHFDKIGFVVLTQEEMVAYWSDKKWKKWIAFGAGFLGVFAVMFAYWILFEPGALSTDSFYQWHEVQTGVYDDWHPMYHTFYIWLFSNIVNEYHFIVLMQMLFFSLACGYMVYVMNLWRMPKWSSVITVLLIVLNPQTRNIMLYVWKDCLFTIFATFIAGCMLQIFFSKGEWFKKKLSPVWLAFLAASMTATRHNGILFTVVLLFFQLCFLKGYRKQVLIAAILSVVLWVGCKYGMNAAFDAATTENQGYVETVGIPMTIMGNVRYYEREKLDDDAASLMALVTDDWGWANIYVPGSYNSIKFQRNASEFLADVPVTDLLAMTWRTIQNAPMLSLQAIYQVTRVVWDIRGDCTWGVIPVISSNAYGYDIAYGEEMAPFREPVVYFDIDMFAACKYIFGFVGTYLICLILIALFTFKRHSFSMFYMVFPILVYDYGTMMLSCGTDYRLFHFNHIIIVPILLALLAGRIAEGTKEKKEKDK